VRRRSRLVIALAAPAALLLLLAALVPAQADQPATATATAGRTEVIRVSGLDAPAAILRTTDGIAHVEATSRHDAFFLQGWLHAADRLFQMDVLRRTPSGTLAELLGQGALASDVQLRTIGLRRAAERSWQAATPRVRAAVTAYTDGVNAYVHRHPLPPEYAALELSSFAGWTPVDSVVVGKLLAFQLSFDLDIDNTTDLQAYLAAGAASGFDGAALFFHDLVPFQPFSSASTVPDANQPDASQADAATTSGRATQAAASAPTEEQLAAAAKLAARYRAAAEKVPLLRQALHRDRSAGSNEWVVSGRHTEDGRPILANDPHLSLSTPAVFYPVQLYGGELDVAGESFAGAPGVIQGHNQWISWGSTVNPMDVTDTYLEAIRPDPTSPSGLSTVYQGQLEHVVAVPETFRANTVGNGTPDDLAVVPPAAGVPPATLVVPRRNNGPIVRLDRAGGTALSVQYTGFSATQEIDTFLQWAEARDLDDFRAGLASFDFGSQNWAYADRQGNIAYFTSGELPLREDLQAGHVTGLPPYFIRNGQGGNEWLPVGEPLAGQAIPYEILPPAEMPHLVDPPAGWFVNANNDPVGVTLDNDPLNQFRPGGGIFYLNPGYDGLRAGRITEMLRAALAGGRRVDRGDIERMQSDTVLLDAGYFVPRLTEAWQRASASALPELSALAADPGIAEAVGRLASWDRSTPTGIPEGYDAQDRNGQPEAPSNDEIGNSVAATIYSLWRSRFIAATLDATLSPYGLPLPDSRQSVTALRLALDGRPWVSGLDPFAVAGVANAADRQAIAMLRAVRTALDRLASPDFAAAFGGSTDQDDYRWGRLHRVVLQHPLGGPFSVPTAFGQFPAPLPGLTGIPVDGGFGTVDAASHDARANSINGFMFGSGPARRYVGVLERSGPAGRSALPGGTSALPTSPHYLDLLPAYLTDDYYPVRTRLADVLSATESSLTLLPAQS
jgi:penicillin amidase